MLVDEVQKTEREIVRSAGVSKELDPECWLKRKGREGRTVGDRSACSRLGYAELEGTPMIRFRMS